MLKNGRPYTIENGINDTKLLTDVSYSNAKKVGEWIRINVRKADKVLEGRTSYGMKHILKDETGVYLTDNQFKDAMLMAGFEPVDPNEPTWHFCINLTREINVNPSPFFNWVKDNVGDEDSPENDFKQDMLRKFDFPVFANHDVIVQYLQFNRACDEAIEIFEELWKAYEG